MDRIQTLVALLRGTVADPAQLAPAVKEFQSVVFSSTGQDLGASPTIVDALRTLAYDLDFYVPDPQARGEDPAYYGDERALREIEQTLMTLHSLGAA